jgi:hypothetical protein
MEGFQAIAKQFINTTKSHLFLTGKAGTGKTTFLKSLSSITHKTFIVIAPTGIAALNAGGVTIHSQFLLPFGLFIPDRFLPENASGKTPFYTQNTLAQKHPLNSSRKKVLRSIDLLVIDEVSMLRADLLDAIDYRMRAARGNFYESFGGVQVLFIGDLYQLPPVVKKDEEELLKKYYKTPWFYEAKALQQDPLVFIEFNKIYRQHDDDFIRLLNNLRNNILTSEDIDILNRHYKTSAEIDNIKEVITLTTHNYKADELNSKAIQALPSPSKYFEAVIDGEFPESMFPVLQKLELKKGAQIMFTRNDPDGVYFNGKLATVAEINGADIWVELAGSHLRHKLKREQWSNKKYSLAEGSVDLDEEVIGSFEQFPVKLAWAITVHKSQGLTFDKAIIDVAEAFADGQVYVALSRLRSLEGLILRTRIKRETVSTDKNVAAFVEHHHQPDGLGNLMKSKQQGFLHGVLNKTFDFSTIVKDLQYVMRQNEETSFKDIAKNLLSPIAEALVAESSNTEKFKRQLAGLIATDHALLIERLGKGSIYYRNLLFDRLKMVVEQQMEMQQHKRVKTYLNQLTELDVTISKKIEEIDKSILLVRAILSEEGNIDTSEIKKALSNERLLMLNEIRGRMPVLIPKKGKKKKKKTGTATEGDELSTYDITISMLKEGLTVSEISEKRKLVPSTIEGHLAKGVEAGLVDISTMVSAEAVEEVVHAIKSFSDQPNLSVLYQHFKGKYSYGILRAVGAYVGLTERKSERQET